MILHAATSCCPSSPPARPPSNSLIPFKSCCLADESFNDRFDKHWRVPLKRESFRRRSRLPSFSALNQMKTWLMSPDLPARQFQLGRLRSTGLPAQAWTWYCVSRNAHGAIVRRDGGNMEQGRTASGWSKDVKATTMAWGRHDQTDLLWQPASKMGLSRISNRRCDNTFGIRAETTHIARLDDQTCDIYIFWHQGFHRTNKKLCRRYNAKVVIVFQVSIPLAVLSRMFCFPILDSKTWLNADWKKC